MAGDGATGSYLSSAELYDPASGTWTATGSMTTATLVSHGDVAAHQARCWWRQESMPTAILASAELYDPASGTWTADRQPDHRTLQSHGDVAALGKVLVAGGYDNSGYLSSAELYDPANGTWTATGSMSTARD